MLFRIFAFALMISIPVFAEDDCDPQVVPPDVLSDLTNVASRLNTECPNQVNVTELCSAVSSQLHETDTSFGTKFSYQTKLYRAACVESTDAPAVIQAKIQNFWNQYHDQLVCNQLGSMVKNGNILKLAVEKNAKDFIIDAVRKWKVSINHKDASDGKTVLDYIDDQLAANSGSTVLKNYQIIFKASGAKNSKDL